MVSRLITDTFLHHSSISVSRKLISLSVKNVKGQKLSGKRLGMNKSQQSTFQLSLFSFFFHRRVTLQITS